MKSCENGYQNEKYIKYETQYPILKPVPKLQLA